MPPKNFLVFLAMQQRLKIPNVWGKVKHLFPTLDFFEKVV
jgi:hypothetical protein